MDNIENEELRQEHEYTPPQEPEVPQTPREQQPPQEAPRPQYHQAAAPYSGAGAGRKESPFADSPYVMNHIPNPYQNHYQHQFQYEPRNSYVPPVEEAPKRKKNGGKFWKGFLSVVLTAALVAAGCGITASVVNSRWEEKNEILISQVQMQITDMQSQIAANSNAATGNSVSGTVQYVADGLTPAQIYAQNVKSVVLINCSVSSSYYGQTVNGTSAGSGFILSEDGYVVTNAHVVEDASSISVTMHDGTEYEAQLVGSDTANDVAVLKMEASGLPAVTLGSSDKLIVGDQVVAIGNPLGELTSTMTVGYVSAKDRDVTTDGTTINMIQTDAAINSGNSGGPLFNMKGEVVGITTAKYSGESASGATIEGIGFAIPMDDVSPLVDDLINYGYVTGAYLGVLVSEMDSATASYYGLPVGAYVQEVTPGYCAEEAGLQAKDIIVGLGDYTVSNLSDLTRALRSFDAGDTTTITVFRNGAQVVLSITLDEKPPVTDSGTAVAPSDDMPEDGSFEEWYNYFAPYFGDGQD